MAGELFTVGHSNMPLERFLALLTEAGITAIADVRSVPHSSYNPQFNQAPLSKALQQAGIAYVPMGNELGARRTEEECYRDQRVSFALTSRSSLFYQGLNRVQTGLKTFNVALMCAEKEPLECHRFGLICRYGAHKIGEARHLKDDGTIETHTEAEDRLLELAGLPLNDLFRPRESLLEEAYAWLENRVAFRRKS